MTEEHIKLAQRIYECRRAAKQIHGAGFESAVAPYIAALNGISEKYNCDTLQAALKLGKLCEDYPTIIMNIMAAACEIIEPSI